MADAIPDDLLKLVPFAGTLAMVASNPEKWARQNLLEWVYDAIAKWVVGGIIDSTQYVLGWLAFAFGRTGSIIGDAAGPLATPFEIVGDAVVGAITGVYDAAAGVAIAAGFAGPIAAAFGFAVTSALLAAIAYAIVSVIPGSDALSAVSGRFSTQ